MAELLTLRKIAKQLAKVASVDEAKEIRDKAEAIRVYSRQQKHCKDIEREATIIRLRAERQLGKLLAQVIRAGNPNCVPGAQLPEGINRRQSSNWQLIAKLPEKQFEELLEVTQPTTKLAVHLARQFIRRKENNKGADSGGNVLSGDMWQLHDHLKDNSVDLFLSDPPYAEIDCYSRIAELAAAKLKSGGLCAVYSGTMYLPEILNLMGKHLTYHWTCCLYLNGAKSRVNTRQIMQAWKPVLLFSKGKLSHDWIVDVVPGQREKELHDWQQGESEAAYLIEKLTRPGQLVVDPYCGSGTTLLAAKRIGRNYLGCELDSNTAKGARRRLAA